MQKVGEYMYNKTVTEVENYKLLAEVICKYCAEKQLTMRDVMSAVSIVSNKFFNDAVI